MNWENIVELYTKLHDAIEQFFLPVGPWIASLDWIDTMLFIVGLLILRFVLFLMEF